MRISDINIYRDGGSIQFQIEHDSQTRCIWLDTPFRGEPRSLRIDSIEMSRGAPEIRQLLDDIEKWWKTLPPALQSGALEAQAHKGAFYNPTAEMMESIDVSRVLSVRDYVAKTYAG